jgi:hypothetical protein
MTEEFLLANYDKYADELVVVDSGELPGAKKRKKSDGEDTETTAEQD